MTCISASFMEIGQSHSRYQWCTTHQNDSHNETSALRKHKYSPREETLRDQGDNGTRDGKREPADVDSRERVHLSIVHHEDLPHQSGQVRGLEDLKDEGDVYYQLSQSSKECRVQFPT